MITFVLDRKERIPLKKFNQLTVRDILNDDRLFKVFVDGNLFFEDPYFPIKEFVMQLSAWDRKGSFNYNTIDDYQNPLISFEYIGERWYLRSIWQLFECNRSFTLQELDVFVKDVINSVIA